MRKNNILEDENEFWYSEKFGPMTWDELLELWFKKHVINPIKTFLENCKGE